MDNNRREFFKQFAVAGGALAFASKAAFAATDWSHEDNQRVN